MNVANIRKLFLHPQPTYALPEGAALLGIDTHDLRGWMESGEIEGIENGEEIVLPWPEMASFAMDLWSQEVVEDALGADVAGVIPELLRLMELEVRIPRMEVVALERLAERDGKSVDAVLARELLDLLSVHSLWLGREVPGFIEALAWPDAG